MTSNEDSWGKTVATFSLSPKTELHIKAGAMFKGIEYINIRKYVKTDKYTGYTKDGLLFPKTLLQDFIKALQKIGE